MTDQTRAHAQEPTAYLHRCPKYGHKPSLSFKKAINPDWTSEPLYLAHCQQPMAWRKPMELLVWWLEGCLKCKEWHWDGQQREAAEDALKEAQAVLETARRTPAGCAAPTIDDIPSCGQENDYRRARPTPAASEGPFNAEMPSSLNDACRRLDLAQERISQLEAQVEEASGLIHDLLGLELGSSERAMAWLDSRSDTSTIREGGQ